MTLTLGFSPCPNDCFMFDAMVHGRIDCEGLDFSVRMADIEALNAAAFAGEVDVTKLSFHAYAYCADDYVLLDAGSALGRNCGPLLISRRPISPEEVASGQLRIAIPGKYTTANFLLSLAFPQATEQDGVSVLGHRGSSARRDLRCRPHHSREPVHLRRQGAQEDHRSRRVLGVGDGGGDSARRDRHQPPAAADVRQRVNRVMRRSVEYAFANRAASLPFVRANAQAMSDDVMYKHIDLYVNDYSVDLGVEGRRAVEVLFERAPSVRSDSDDERGSLPQCLSHIFSKRSDCCSGRRLLRTPGRSSSATLPIAEVTRYLGWPRHTSVEDTRHSSAFSQSEWARWPARTVTRLRTRTPASCWEVRAGDGNGRVRAQPDTSLRGTPGDRATPPSRCARW